MDDLAGSGIIWKGGVDPVEEGVEPAQPDGVHALALGQGVVPKQLGEEDLSGVRGTARLLSFSSSMSPFEKALRRAKATVS